MMWQLGKETSMRFSRKVEMVLRCYRVASAGSDLKWKRQTMSTIYAGEVRIHLVTQLLNQMASLQWLTIRFTSCTWRMLSTTTLIRQTYRLIYFSRLSATPKLLTRAVWLIMTRSWHAPESPSSNCGILAPQERQERSHSWLSSAVTRCQSARLLMNQLTIDWLVQEETARHECGT